MEYICLGEVTNRAEFTNKVFGRSQSLHNHVLETESHVEEFHFSDTHQLDDRKWKNRRKSSCVNDLFVKQWQQAEGLWLEERSFRVLTTPRWRMTKRNLMAYWLMTAQTGPARRGGNGLDLRWVRRESFFLFFFLNVVITTGCDALRSNSFLWHCAQCYCSLIPAWWPVISRHY